MANWDQAEGELKEQGGRLTGDEDLEREGKAQGALGDTKDKLEDAKDEAGGAWEDAKDKL
ncbi:MAG TPA: CsbD family protein [Gaiellaceae bacterium]|nr:CsbD family protein [Gaiellaceae bacterium]